MEVKHLQHLYSRAGFGLLPSVYNELNSNSKSKNEILKTLFFKSKKTILLEIDLSELSVYLDLNTMVVRKDLDEKEKSDLRKIGRDKIKDFNNLWIERLRDTNAVLREKMTLFWANVFVCKDNDIRFIQQYNNTLRENALGHFGDFVKAIAKAPSMSKYLNNKQNVKRSPNENFARELMELFTLGEGHYTEQDIKESAKAFTGWNYKEDGSFFLKTKKHDYGTKTFFGKTGTFNGDDIIDIILEQKQCARFICTKIYKYFINPEINESFLNEITEVFYKDYNIEKLMLYIFSSNWFYNEENIGVKIKSPIELFVGIQKIVPLEFQKKKQLLFVQKVMGQTLLYPPNVAGWKQNRSWIDGNTLMFRMKLASLLINNSVINLDEKGGFEDSFDDYYKKEKSKKRFFKTTKNWKIFNQEFQNLEPEVLKQFLIIASIDKDTDALLDNLAVTSNKDYLIQLMSIPEYQLC